jgi:hypothetical protein
MGTERQHQRGQHRSALPGAQLDYRRISGRALDATVPRTAVVGTIAVLVIVAVVVLEWYETTSAKVNPSWTVTKLVEQQLRRVAAQSSARFVRPGDPVSVCLAVPIRQRELGVRVVVAPPVPRVAGYRVEVPPVVLDVLAAVPLRSGRTVAR